MDQVPMTDLQRRYLLTIEPGSGGPLAKVLNYNNYSVLCTVKWTSGLTSGTP